jgi:WD40 repeat protein
VARVFISHSSANSAEALALGQWLESQGWSDYFLDVSADRGIVPGERWMAALAGAVDRCEAVLFLISSAWRDSKYCFAEFFEAKKLGKRIFGLIIEPIPLAHLPEQMTAEWQVCDLVCTGEAVSFTVEGPPLVGVTRIEFPRTGLEALARGLRKAGLDPATFPWPPNEDPGRSPYPGLRALDRSDAAVFFGREAAIVRAFDQIRLTCERGIERLFVILGASGAGKSSFLKAGILPRLTRDSENFVVLPTIRTERAAISGTEGLLASLQHGLASAGVQQSRAQLREDLLSTGLEPVLGRLASARALDARPGQIDRCTVVVPVDQFEELFSTDGQIESSQFLDLIGMASGAAAPTDDDVRKRARVLFVITIRSDALPALQDHPGGRRLGPVLFSLPAMPASEFKAVIEGPARRHSETVKPLLVTPALTEALIADSQGSDALPLLALTLEWLYREFMTEHGARLGVDEYQRLGRVRGVIDSAVNRALSDADTTPSIPARRQDQDRALERVFGLIATVDPDTLQAKRRVALRSEIRSDSPETDAIVGRLIDQRLLRSDLRRVTDGEEPVEVVEIAHEALLRQWEFLERWLTAMSAELAMVEAVRRCAVDWQKSNFDEEMLVHVEHRLRAAEVLLTDSKTKHRFSVVDTRYLVACRGLADRRTREREEQLRLVAEQQDARARLQRRLSIFLSMTAVVLAGLLVWIVTQTRNVALQGSLLITSASEKAADDKIFERALRLALLASHHSWLHPSHPTSLVALARAAAGNSQRSLLRHEKLANSAAFSPDGQRVVTASADGAARLWDTRTGNPLGEPMRHQGEVWSAVFSSDGQRVVTASADGTARIWDARSGKPLGDPMRHQGLVRSANFSHDDKRVVTASADGTARVWDVLTGKPVGEPMLHEREEVWSAVFSPDGQRVVTASADKTARVWDAQSGKPVSQPMRHDSLVRSALFSSDGQRVVTASADWTARVWDAQSGRPVSEAMKHEGEVWSAFFSPNGEHVVTASADKTARVWDAQSGKPVSQAMRHRGGEVRSAVFSPDGRYVVTASADRTARVWDAQSGKPLGEPRRHDDEVWSAVFSPDGQHFVTTSLDRTARVWDAQSGIPLGEPMKHGSEVRSASFSPDGRRVVTASDDKTARAWDAQSGKSIGEPMRHGDLVSSAVFSPDGRRIVTASADGTARVWDALSGKPLGEPMRHENEELVRSAVFSPDGRHVVTASDDKTARVWDAESGKPLGEPMRHKREVFSAVFSPDGQRVVTASSDTTARVWDAGSGKAPVELKGHDGEVLSALFSPDGRRVVTASLDKTARVWDAESGKPLGQPMRHDGLVRSASFSPDGQRVVTASADRTARVWDVQSATPLGQPMRHDDEVLFAVFSADGQRVVTASADKKARIWDGQTGKPLVEPMRHEGLVRSAMFSPDGQHVVTASADQTARVWVQHWAALSGERGALIQAACMSTSRTARLITEEDLYASRILPPGFRVGDDACEGIASVRTAG